MTDFVYLSWVYKMGALNLSTPTCATPSLFTGGEFVLKRNKATHLRVAGNVKPYYRF
jgi:hypothetical protein